MTKRLQKALQHAARVFSPVKPYSTKPGPSGPGIAQRIPGL